SWAAPPPRRPLPPPPLAGEGWGGGCLKCGDNSFQDALPIRHHVVVVESKDAEAFRSEKQIASDIAMKVGVFEMLTAVQLHNQIGGVAHEVRDIRSNRSLPTKARAVEAMRAKRIPNGPFSVG